MSDTALRERPADGAAHQAATDAWRGFLARFPQPKELVLIQPPLVPEQFFDVKTARGGGYYNFPPTGLLYIATVAREERPDLKITLLDLNHLLLEQSHDPAFRYTVWQDRVRETVAACEAPMVGVTFMFGTTKPCYVDVTSFLRREFPGVPLLSGGVQATFDYREILQDGQADLVTRREGEEQFRSFLRGLSDPEVAPAPGLAFRLDGEIHEVAGAIEPPALAADIRWSYDLIDMSNYYAYGCLGAFSRYVGTDRKFGTVLTNRGCRARCTFCTVRNFNGFGVRQRSVQDVIDEVKHLKEAKGVTYIDWLDDDLLWDRERALELFNGLAEQVPGLEWTASNGLIGVSVDEEMIDAMVRSGLKAYKIGIESGNDRRLKQIKKPTTKKKLRERNAWFKKYPEVLTSTNFIIGFPEESFGEMRDTYDFAAELAWDWSSFYICQPLRGTEMFTDFADLGDERTKEERYDKMINPGRSAERGEFGYRFKEAKRTYTGWDVFEIPEDTVPDLDQQKEIWFTFNLVANFLGNPCFEPGGNPMKIARWIEAIHSGYPYDASMAAALSHAYRLAGHGERAAALTERFGELCAGSDYWRDRVRQFPELLLLAGLDTPPDWFDGALPTRLMRPLPTR